jgi:hypothetical protein
MILVRKMYKYSFIFPFSMLIILKQFKEFTEIKYFLNKRWKYLWDEERKIFKKLRFLYLKTRFFLNIDLFQRR